MVLPVPSPQGSKPFGGTNKYKNTTEVAKQKKPKLKAAEEKGPLENNFASHNNKKGGC